MSEEVPIRKIYMFCPICANTSRLNSQRLKVDPQLFVVVTSCLPCDSKSTTGIAYRGVEIYDQQGFIYKTFQDYLEYSEWAYQQW